MSYKRHRFPFELIAHAEWLYFCFLLSFRLVEEMLLERGIVVSYETIRRWSLKFGTAYARSLRRKSAKPNDVWHLDDVRIVIRCKPHWLWRAVDQDGSILDEILQTRRNAKAARRLLTRLLKQQGLRPVRMITDRLKSYGAARRKLSLSIRYLSHKGLNDRAESSHLPLQKRERMMQKFRSPGGCQRFVSAFSAIRNLFVPPASITTALSRHLHRVQALAQWNSATVLSA
ncbi:IS6 family transposase [Asaia sp. BMEF1]|uniref:IS6 family transposase n=1 Tax=Asaia sp. BMEF1 TaxID=3155932 RepID=UPI003F6741FE